MGGGLRRTIHHGKEIEIYINYFFTDYFKICRIVKTHEQSKKLVAIYLLTLALVVVASMVLLALFLINYLDGREAIVGFIFAVCNFCIVCLPVVSLVSSDSKIKL